MQQHAQLVAVVNRMAQIQQGGVETATPSSSQHTGFAQCEGLSSEARPSKDDDCACRFKLSIRSANCDACKPLTTQSARRTVKEDDMDTQFQGIRMDCSCRHVRLVVSIVHGRSADVHTCG